MPTTAVRETKLKVLLKDAVSEVFEENKDFIRETVLDVFEDIALTRAIQEGEKTKTISKAKVLNILKIRK
ncbi:MAG: hypothetical protein V1799_19520 [bacterium]